MELEKIKKTKSRIAPTPSGLLHLGNVFSFVLTSALVKNQKGLLRLRIDDLDSLRVRQEYIEDIFETLDWLGIEFDEGPSTVSEVPKFSQAFRVEIYRQALLKIESHCFACRCTKSQVGGERYPGTCSEKNLDKYDQDLAWRLRVIGNCLIEIPSITGPLNHFDLDKEMGSFVVRRKDQLPAYQLASLVDDIEYGINFIVRGNDLLPSTAAQIYLSTKRKEWGEFSKAQFFHHSLLLSESGEKLSKSQGAESLKRDREAGTSRKDIFTRFIEILYPKLKVKCDSLNQFQDILNTEGLKNLDSKIYEKT